MILVNYEVLLKHAYSLLLPVLVTAFEKFKKLFNPISTGGTLPPPPLLLFLK